jgi:hypothetical protein
MSFPVMAYICIKSPANTCGAPAPRTQAGPDFRGTVKEELSRSIIVLQATIIMLKGMVTVSTVAVFN